MIATIIITKNGNKNFNTNMITAETRTNAKIPQVFFSQFGQTMNLISQGTFVLKRKASLKSM